MKDWRNTVFAEKVIGTDDVILWRRFPFLHFFTKIYYLTILGDFWEWTTKKKEAEKVYGEEAEMIVDELGMQYGGVRDTFCTLMRKSFLEVFAPRN